MPIDASIALGVRAPKFTSPQEMYAQKAQFDQNELANRLNGAKLQEYERGVSESNSLASVYRSAVGQDGRIDRNKLFSGAAGAGLGAKIPGLQKEFAAQDKDAAEMDAKKFETASKRLDVMGQALGWLKDNPSPENAQQALSFLASNGVMDEKQMSAAMQQLQANLTPQGIAQFATLGFQASLKAKEQLPTFQTRNTGGTTDTLSINPVTQKVTVANSVRNTQSPESIASNAVQMRGQNMTDARGREANEIARTKAGAAGPDGRPSKPMPATALKMQNEALDIIGIASSIQADLGTLEKQLETGKLNFGPIRNFANNARNLAGMSDEESRNFSTFKSSMEKLRNDSLRLNKGVQTDGDAQRAWNELFQNINDKGLVKQRLAEIKAINARAVDLRKREVEDIRNNYNQQQYDFGTQTNVPSAITPPAGAPNIDALLDKYK